MFFDWTYLIIVMPMLIISFFAQAKVQSTYTKYSKVFNRRGYTAEQAARMILDKNGLRDVGIGRISGNLTDNYNPKTNIISLSDAVYGSTSVAAIGVAAHEAGHAIQHANEYTPIKIRTAIVPITQIGSQLSMPLVLLGLVFGIYPLAYIGIILFGAVVLFQLVTLPAEFNASRRALAALSDGYLADDEVRGAKKVLSAAAMTYVAALFVALANLLRLLIIVSGGRNNRRD